MTNASRPLSEFMYRSLFGTMNSEQFQQFINKFEDLKEEIQSASYRYDRYQS